MSYLCLGIIVVLSVNVLEAQQRAERNFQGRIAQKSSWNFIASVCYGRYAVCGGAVISEKWVITAAFCVDKKRHENTTIWYGPVGVRIGPDDLDFITVSTIVAKEYKCKVSTEVNVSAVHAGSTIPVDKIVFHPDYKREEKEEGAAKLTLDAHGVSLLKLRLEIPESIPVVPINTEKILSEYCKTAGWSRISSLHSEPYVLGTKILQELDVKILKTEECGEYLVAVISKFELSPEEKMRFIASKRCAESTTDGSNSSFN